MLAQGARSESRGSYSGPGGCGSLAAALDTQTGWGEHDAQWTGTWAEGSPPNKDEPPLETQGMHAGLGRGEAPPRPFTSWLLETKLSWQLRAGRDPPGRAVGIGLPAKSGGTIQGLWAMRGRRRNLRAGTTGGLCSGSSQGQCRVRQKPAWASRQGREKQGGSGPGEQAPGVWGPDEGDNCILQPQREKSGWTPSPESKKQAV